LDTCTAAGEIIEDYRFQDLSEKYGNKIIYTYSVKFERSDTLWSSRWDIYLKQGNNKIHWLSIVNSTCLVLFLSALVAVIVIRNLWKDIKKYNLNYERVSTIEKGGDGLKKDDSAMFEETGWKLVHADVFRPPSRFPLLLSTMVGTGFQLLTMIYFLLGFAVLGFLSPANRGSLLTCLLLLFIFMGAVGGYVSARVYVMFC
jgi:transmembrane 9 superfamily member 2/4